jgi:FkbM family methyltransferase
MPVRRWIVRRAAGWLPETLKRLVRPSRIGFRAAAIGVHAAFSADDGGPLVLVDRRFTLRFREEDREEVAVLLRDNGESVEETASFLGLASSAHVLFDIGAAKAVFSEMFCLSNPDASAVAFEPSPQLAPSAAALIALNGCGARIRLRRCAVGAMPGRHTARLYPWGYVGVDGPEGEGERVEVEMTSVDGEVEQLGVEPDLLKIDVEGYEYEVLLGATRLLKARKPPICLELHLDLLEKRGIAPRRVLLELEKYGYHFYSCVGRPLRAAQILGSVNAVMRLVAR